MARHNSISFVLAGGKGERLSPLCNERAKPAVPFGGHFRVIDFPLSNLMNSGFDKIVVPIQYRHKSLQMHIDDGWHPLIGSGRGAFIRIAPAMMGENHDWYTGTANAVQQNRNYITDEKATYVFGGDHIYLMDVKEFEDFHWANRADLSISVKRVPRKLAANNYGVLTIDKNNQVLGFTEKPADPDPIPGDEENCMVSMGNYAFKTKSLQAMLDEDFKKEFTKDPELLADKSKYSKHDFGYDIIPAMVEGKWRVFAYDFSDHLVDGAEEKERGYWRDIGNLDEFWKANMEIRDPNPTLNLYNPEWPIQTYYEPLPPPKFVHAHTYVENSIVSNGMIISGATVISSVIGTRGKIEENARVFESVLMGNDRVGTGASISRAILDKDVVVPAYETIGHDREKDLARGFTISEGGITVVPKGYVFK